MLDAPKSAAADQGTAYPNLFSPFSKGALKLRNRVVFAAMSTRYAEKGLITQRLIDFHVSRAKGGVSMSVTEPLAMLRRQESNQTKVAVQQLSPVLDVLLPEALAFVEPEEDVQRLDGPRAHLPLVPVDERHDRVARHHPGHEEVDRDRGPGREEVEAQALREVLHDGSGPYSQQAAQ